MTKKGNEFLSDLANVYLKHDKLDRVVRDQANLSNNDFNQLARKLANFHQQSAKELRDILESLPDVPVHNSINKTSTVGLPMQEYSLQDLESRSDTYICCAIVEAETSLRKYYQDSLMNVDMPKEYKLRLKEQLNKLSKHLSELEHLDKVFDE